MRRAPRDDGRLASILLYAKPEKNEAQGPQVHERRGGSVGQRPLHV